MAHLVTFVAFVDPIVPWATSGVAGKAPAAASEFHIYGHTFSAGDEPPEGEWI